MQNVYFMYELCETEECSYILSCNVFDLMDKLKQEVTFSCKKMQINERNLKIGHNWFGMMSEWNVFIPNFLYNSKNTTCTWKVICF